MKPNLLTEINLPSRLRFHHVAPQGGGAGGGAIYASGGTSITVTGASSSSTVQTTFLTNAAVVRTLHIRFVGRRVGTTCECRRIALSWLSSPPLCRVVRVELEMK